MSEETVRSDAVGSIEQHGINIIPDAERHGKPRDLFFMWLGTNLNVFYIVNGAVIISMGLSFPQAIIAILIGNCAFFALGLTSQQGSSGRRGSDEFHLCPPQSAGLRNC